MRLHYMIMKFIHDDNWFKKRVPKWMPIIQCFEFLFLYKSSVHTLQIKEKNLKL